MSPDPVKCPSCGSTQIGNTMTAGQINEGFLEGTLSGMGSTMYMGKRSQNDGLLTAIQEFNRIIEDDKVALIAVNQSSRLAKWLLLVT